MKYIRTTDGIYDTTKMSYKTLTYGENGLQEILSYQKQISENCIKVISCKDIIKQADIIEELCDGLIVEEKDNPSQWFVMDIKEFKELDIEERLYSLKNWNFTAFIKNYKGLIYVAKMDDKGELELL